MARFLALDELAVRQSHYRLYAALGSNTSAAGAASVPFSAAPAPAPPAAAATVAEEDETTHHALLALLTRHGAAFTQLQHAATRTSDESARVRGVSLASGSKAMLLKAGKPLAHGSAFLLAVMSASCSISWPRIRSLVGTSQLSMAPLDEVARLTRCLPGAVPPFGSLFPGVRTFVDRSLLQQGALINFNAALRTRSILGLTVADFLRIEGENAVVDDFTVPPPA